MKRRVNCNTILVTVLAVVAFSLIGGTNVMGREWQVGGRKMIGEFVGLDGDRVGIRLASGRMMIATVDRLADVDVAYVKNMLELRRLHAAAVAPAAEVSSSISAGDLLLSSQLSKSYEIQSAQWQVQQGHLVGMDVWTVQFMHPQRGLHWVWVQAHHSADAWAAAAAQFPQSKVLIVQKVRR